MVTSRYGSAPVWPSTTKAGKVKIAPAATASPAEAMVWTTLFSRIVARPSARSTAIEITAAGMLAETVIPAYSPR